jgi:hypothetical protein
VQQRAFAVIGGDQKRRRAQAIVENWHASVEKRLEFHAELGQRSAGDHRNALVQARFHQGTGGDQRGGRSGAKVLHIHARRIGAAAHLADAFRHPPGAALIAVAGGLLAAADDVIDFLRADRLAMQQRLQRNRPGGLDAQRFQQCVGVEIGVFAALGAVIAAPEWPRNSAIGFSQPAAVSSTRAGVKTLARSRVA